MSLNLKSSGGGSVTVDVPSTASNYTATLPAATGTVMVSGNQPAFSAVSNATQSITNATSTKVTFSSEEFDTANCYDNTSTYRFTPTVAGYYQINAAVQVTAAQASINLYIFKNGSNAKQTGNDTSSTAITKSHISTLVYLNGSTDYIELYIFISGSTTTITNNNQWNFFQASMVRAA